MIKIILWLLAAAVLLIILLTIIDLIKRHRLKGRYQFLEEIAEEAFGYNISLYGKIGAGKSSLLNGMSHLFTGVLFKKIEKKIAAFKRMFIKINYIELDAFIFSCWNEIKDIQIIYQKTLEKFFATIQGLTFDDGLTIHKAEDELFYYVEAFVRRLDNNFVACNYRLKNQITNTYNVPFDSELLNIKDIAENENGFYGLERYLIMVEDEKSLDSDVDPNAHLTFSKEDKGALQFYTLMRQIGRETMFYINANQRAKGFVKALRDLATASIMIDSHDIVGYLPTVLFLIKILCKTNDFIYRLRTLFKITRAAKNEYRNKSNIFKKIDNILYRKEKIIFSKCYLIFHTQSYFKSEDLNKINTANNMYYFDIDLVIPLRYCYGVADTFFYSFIHELLKKHSIGSFYKLKEMAGLLTEEDKEALGKAILAKKKTKTESKKANAGIFD